MPYDAPADDLDLDSALPVLNDALTGADDGELFLERGVSESFVFDDGRLKTAAFDATRGFGLRCVAGESTGYAHSSEMTVEALKRAASAVQAAKRGHSGVMAEDPRRTNRTLYGDAAPTAAPAFKDKVALLQEIDAYARAADPRVVQVTASLAGGRREIDIVRPGGGLY